MKRFDELLGNQAAKALLGGLLDSDKIPSTLLFEGPSGVGKALFAKAFANAAMRLDLSQQHCLDLIEILPEGKSAMHAMGSLKEMISSISLMPHQARYKFFIIHDAEKMLPIHANALLKTLEEPPEHARIILLTQNKEDLLETIVSRSVLVPFYLIEEEALFPYLVERKGIEKEKAQFLLPLLSGSLERLSFYCNEECLKFQEMILSMLKAFFSNQISYGCMLLESIEKWIAKAPIEDGAKYQHLVLEYLLYWYRDGYLLHNQIGDHFLFFSQETKALSELVELKNLQLEKVYAKMQQAKDALERNMKLKHIIEQMLFSTSDLIASSAH